MKKLHHCLRDVGNVAIRTWMAGVFILSLGVNGLKAQPGDCDALAGTLSSASSSLCLMVGGTMLEALPGGDAVVPDGFSTTYVLTMGEELVIMDAGSDPMFTVTGLGHYTIHTLVYEPETLDLSVIVLGVTTGFDVNALLIQGGGEICASLDVTGAAFHVDDPDAGGLTPDLMAVCLEEGMAMLSATPDGDMYVPEGYSVGYVLTSGEGLVYQEMSASPSFTVNAYGVYTIHTLVYHGSSFDATMLVAGVTTGLDIHAMLVQGGGDICASLDAGGAMFFVIDCEIGDCDAYAGGLTTEMPTVCLMDGMAMIAGMPDGTMVVPEGYQVAYGLTMAGTGLVIEQISATPSFTVMAMGHYTIHTLVYHPDDIDLSSITLGVSTAVEIAASFLPLGELCAALDVDGVTIHVMECDEDVCMAMAGGLTASIGQVCLTDGGASVGAMASGGLVVPTGYEVRYVLTSGAAMTIYQVSETPSFMVDATGSYTIHTLVYDPTTLDLSVVTPGVTTGADVHALLIQGGGTICAALDLTGATITVVACPPVGDCPAYAGTLMPLKSIFCYVETGSVIGATVVGDAVVPPGYVARWVATKGPGMVIVDIGETAWFVVDGMGQYNIHTLVYNPATLDVSSIQMGVTTAAQVHAMLVQGGGEICASLDMTGVTLYVEEPSTPMLTADMGMVCIEGGSATVSATAGAGMYLPMGYTYTHILTMGDAKVIKQVSMTPSFTVTETGHYKIHTLVYDPETFPLGAVTMGVTTAFDVHGMLVYGGGVYCAALDLSGVSVHVMECDDDCPAYAGTLLPLKSIFCYVETGSVIGATVVGDAVVPPGYVARWIATQGPGMVIVGMGETAWFVVEGMGLHTIHTIVYNPATFDASSIQLGVTTAAQVNAMLVQGGGEVCGSLDMTGVALYVEEPATPTLAANAMEVCLEGTATVSATAGSGMYLPMGYSYIHILTKGDDKVIMQSSMTPSFTVTETGHYTIHTFVYDPETFPLAASVTYGVTTAHDVHGMLVYGGGVYCAVLDLMGASVHVIDCGPVDCPAYAGTLTAEFAQICQEIGATVIMAMGNDDMVVPAGYTTTYVLTMGGLIMDMGSDPSFDVIGAGAYTIHTLVYHPATLDLGTITTGVTTAASVNALLIQGGGSICASLDLVGATTMVIDCDPVLCTAIAGTLAPDDFEICLDEGSVTITAQHNNDMVVPAGYQVAYVLTLGGVIMDAGDMLAFTVTSPGSYTFHTLVYHPSTLDLSTITPGVTTAASVNAMLLQGGGSICASLDLTGGTTMVIDCTIDCPVATGTITVADTATICLEDGMAMVVAFHGGDAVMPEGYVLRYVLTRGLTPVIYEIGETPEFTVTMDGMYRIHPFVFPEDLDLSGVVYGETSALVVNAMLIQGGGDICAALDLIGVSFTVAECMEECPAMSGSITPETSILCLEEGMAELIALPGEDAVIPEGYVLKYVLTAGVAPVIIEVGDMPEFMVMEEGIYTIHTLVYDSLTLDLGMVVPGTTPALAVHELLIQGGGTICASLDLIGATFTVTECEVCLAYAGTLTTDMMEVCLVEGLAILNAMGSGDAVVPDGYSTLYILTYGEDGTIVEVSDGPSMLVTMEGGYTMHTLVYDPTTLSLGFITLDVTPVADLIAALSPTTGLLCASLDVEGVSFIVTTCVVELMITNAWPVPTLDQLTLELSVPAGPTAQLALFNSMGQQVTATRSVGAGAEQVVLDVSALEGGFYTIRLMSTNGISTYNFTKGN